MHNFTVAFVMDTLRTKSAIVVTHILDEGSKLPVFDEKKNAWDYSNDEKYKKGVIGFVRCVFVCVCANFCKTSFQKQSREEAG